MKLLYNGEEIPLGGGTSDVTWDDVQNKPEHITSSDLEDMYYAWSNFPVLFYTTSRASGARIKTRDTLTTNMGWTFGKLYVGATYIGFAVVNDPPATPVIDNTFQVFTGTIRAIDNDNHTVTVIVNYVSTYVSEANLVKGVTRAEYTALTAAQKYAGAYFITDEQVIIYRSKQYGGSPSSTTSAIPTGGIIIWSGAANAVPDGWALCDGNNGTPDLRDKFVLCAGTSHAVGSTGGSEEVTLTVEQMPEHKHIKQADDVLSRSGGGTSGGYIRDTSATGFFVTVRATNVSVGGSQPHSNMPPYYTLAYIMKL